MDQGNVDGRLLGMRRGRKFQWEVFIHKRER